MDTAHSTMCSRAFLRAILCANFLLFLDGECAAVGLLLAGPRVPTLTFEHLHPGTAAGSGGHVAAGTQKSIAYCAYSNRSTDTFSKDTVIWTVFPCRGSV